MEGSQQNRERFLGLINQWGQDLNSGEIERLRTEVKNSKGTEQNSKAPMSEEEMQQNAKDFSMTQEDALEQIKALQQPQPQADAPRDIDTEVTTAAEQYFQADNVETLENAITIAQSMGSFYAAYNSTDQHQQYQLIPQIIDLLDKSLDNIEDKNKEGETLNKALTAVKNMSFRTSDSKHDMTEKETKTGRERKTLQEKIEGMMPLVSATLAKIESNKKVLEEGGRLNQFLEKAKKQPFPYTPLAVGSGGAVAGGLIFVALKLTNTLGKQGIGAQIGIGIAAVVGCAAALLGLYAGAEKVSTHLKDTKEAKAKAPTPTIT